MVMMKEQLIAKILEARDRLSSVDPAVVTQDVYDKLTVAERANALGITLHNWVRMLLNDPPSRFLAQPTPRPSPTAETAAPGPSRKTMTGIFLDAAFAPEIGHKFLGLCVPADILVIARYKHQKGQEVVAQAGRYERLHEEMLARKAKTVADLPEQLVCNILRGDA